GFIAPDSERTKRGPVDREPDRDHLRIDRHRPLPLTRSFDPVDIEFAGTARRHHGDLVVALLDDGKGTVIEAGSRRRDLERTLPGVTADYPVNIYTAVLVDDKGVPLVRALTCDRDLCSGSCRMKTRDRRSGPLPDAAAGDPHRAQSALSVDEQHGDLVGHLSEGRDVRA